MLIICDSICVIYALDHAALHPQAWALRRLQRLLGHGGTMSGNEVAALATCTRAMACCAVEWGWTEDNFVRLAKLCFRWERDGEIPVTLRSRGSIINAKASAGARLVEATEALQRARCEDEKDRAVLRVAEAAAELDRATKALDEAGGP